MGRAAKNLHHNILSGKGRSDYSQMGKKAMQSEDKKDVPIQAKKAASEVKKTSTQL